MSRLLGHYIDTAGLPAFAGKHLDPTAFTGGVARVSAATDGKVGVIDREGKVLIAPRFDFIDPFVGGVAKVNVGGRLDRGNLRGGLWGYVAADGTVLAEPQYETACDLEDDRLTVMKDGKAGFLDARAQVVVAPRYAYASWHHDGLAVVALDGGDAYVDRDGNVVIAGPFQEGTVFTSGIAKVKQRDRWGIIDLTGRLVHECVYERLGMIKDGACWAVKDGQCYVLTAKGEQLGGAFDEVNQVSDDGIWPVRRGEHWSYLFPDGTLVGQYARALGFHGGYGRVQEDGKWGFAQKDGTIVVPCRYLDAFPMGDDRAPVQTEAGWTYVDPTGREHGPGGFGSAGRFEDNRARVRQGDRWGFLDRDGAFAVAPAFDWVGDFADGRAPVIAADRAGLARTGARDKVHVLPEGGLTHPVFSTAGAESHLIAILGFGRELTPAQQMSLGKRIDVWERCVHPAGKLYTEDKWVSPYTVYLRVEGLADPCGDVSLLVDDLFDAGLPITETLYARWGWPPGERVMFPHADPRMPTQRYEANFPDFPAYWAAVWGDDVLPAPENAFYLKGALQTQDGGLCLEERHMPLWFSDVKVCMGALQGQGEDYLPPDDRSARVEAAVRAAIDRRFGHVWVHPDVRRVSPAPMVRSGDPGVEPIAYEGARGYAFAFSCRDLLHWFSGPRMRYRERELMEALREAVLELGLAPVILWQRFQRQIPMLPMGTPTVLVVNLWDPRG